MAMVHFTLLPHTGTLFLIPVCTASLQPLRDSGYCSRGDPSHPSNLNCGLCKPKIGTLSPCHLRIVSTELWVLSTSLIARNRSQRNKPDRLGLKGDRWWDTRLNPLLEHTRFLPEEELDLYSVPSVLPCRSTSVQGSSEGAS